MVVGSVNRVVAVARRAGILRVANNAVSTGDTSVTSSTEEESAAILHQVSDTKVLQSIVVLIENHAALVRTSLNVETTVYQLRSGTVNLLSLRVNTRLLIHERSKDTLARRSNFVTNSGLSAVILLSI